MNHAVSITDMASLDSSSSSSPIYLKHQPYTVQSPSTQSHDGDKSSVQSSSTQLYTNNPMGHTSRPTYTVQSPSSESLDGYKSSVQSSSNLPYTSLGIASPMRTSSTFLSSSGSRVSGMRRNWNWNRNEKVWNQCYVVFEEEEEEHEYGNGKWQWLVGVLLAIGAVCLIIWGVTMPYKPRIAVESLAVNNFYFGEGSDYTGVPTEMLTVNCTMNMAIRNTAAFFGIHVSSSPVELSYLDIPVASGQMKSYYQPRKSKQVLSLNLEGNKIPLYGAGPSLARALTHGGIPLRLGFNIQSWADVVWKLIKAEHQKHIACAVNISSSNPLTIRFKKDFCRYD